MNKSSSLVFTIIGIQGAGTSSAKIEADRCLNVRKHIGECFGTTSARRSFGISSCGEEADCDLLRKNMEKSEVTSVIHFLERLASPCLQLLQGEVPVEVLSEQMEPHYLIGRTYQEVAQLRRLWRGWRQRIGPPSPAQVWDKWGKPLAQRLRQACTAPILPTDRPGDRMLLIGLADFLKEEKEALWRTFLHSLEDLLATAPPPEAESPKPFPGRRALNWDFSEPPHSEPSSEQEEPLQPGTLITLVHTLAELWELVVLADFIVEQWFLEPWRSQPPSWHKAFFCNIHPDSLQFWWHAAHSPPGSEKEHRDLLNILIFLPELVEEVAVRLEQELPRAAAECLREPLLAFVHNVALGQEPYALAGGLESRLSQVFRQH
jgi:hypothetical protein